MYVRFYPFICGYDEHSVRDGETLTSVQKHRPIELLSKTYIIRKRTFNSTCSKSSANIHYRCFTDIYSKANT